MVTLFTSNIDNKFSCDLCDFKCSKKGDWNRHILTQKHKMMYKVTENDELIHKNIKDYSCNNCSKKYNSRNGIWLHKKKCISVNNEPSQKAEEDLKNLTTLVIDLIKSNQSLQQQMLDVCQKNQPINSNNTINNHSNNKTFNLNFFLNEQCKDAMNLMDFVNTIQLKISDMERIGELGYVEGISNIIMENLNELDIYKRPIHCSDAKRETMHIKDKGIWEKDTINNDKMRKAIKHITWLNSKLLFAWAADHPGVIYSDHKLNDKYSEMILEAMGGKRNKTMEEGEAKIIKKISKLVLIDKTIL
jgi:hypothetical protein